MTVDRGAFEDDLQIVTTAEATDCRAPDARRALGGGHSVYGRERSRDISAGAEPGTGLAVDPAMDEVWLVPIIGTVCVVVFSTLMVWLLGQRNAHRWGRRRGQPRRTGEGVYREVIVEEPGAPQGVPWVVRIAAWLAIPWAVVTMLGLAPAGLFLALIVFESAHPAALSIPVALVALDGFALGLALIVACVILLRARPKASLITRRVAGWSGVHHLAVWSVFGAWCFVGDGAALDPMRLDDTGLGLLAFSTLPCLFGLAHSVLLLAAAQKARVCDGRVSVPSSVAVPEPVPPLGTDPLLGRLERINAS